MHFFEPHEPYVAHPGFQFGAGDVDRYDSEIAYTDAAVGRLVGEVRARRPGTIVIVAADHGEEFDEHGGRYHGSSLYEEQLRIPLIVSIPGVAPHVVDGQVELFDVTPTVLALLDISVPARMRGTDLGPWLATPPAPARRGCRPRSPSSRTSGWSSLGGEKLHLRHATRPSAPTTTSTADPHERRNLAEERPARAAFLRGLLDHWLDAHLTSSRAGARASDRRRPRRFRRRSSAAGSAISAPRPSWRRCSAPRAPLAERREAAALLVGLPPQPATAPALARAASDPDGALADWAAVGSLPARRRRCARARGGAGRRSEDASPALRVRAALALAATGDGGGLPVLAEALDRRDDILLCRLIIVTLGKLGDRRAVPVLLQHLPEVQNRREMVEALGLLADPAAIGPLVENLRHDAYVPVRAEAARSLAKIVAKVSTPTSSAGSARRSARPRARTPSRW